MTLEACNIHLAGRLDSISARLEPGTVTAICGPNGAGKSSLLEALAGLLKVEGTVVLDGQPIDRLRPRERARRIGFLPQNGEIAWDLSVRSLVTIGRLQHSGQSDEQVERALRSLDLERLGDRPISTLSGGERVRTLLARVFAGEPDWILADEPLAALDLAHQLALLAILRRSAVNGAGVILVLHDLALAMNHADRVLVLREGGLVADDVPSGALSEETISSVWGVAAKWRGPPGAYALSLPISDATIGNDKVC